MMQALQCPLCSFQVLVTDPYDTPQSAAPAMVQHLKDEHEISGKGLFVWMAHVEIVDVPDEP